MNANVLSKLEKDTKFKKENLPQYFWFKQPAIYPPAAMLFLALYGLIYLLNIDKLISLYAIPFVALLLIGAIWLKTTKRYIWNNILKNEDSFRVCLAKVFGNKNGSFFVIFSVLGKRHDKHYIDNIEKKLQEYLSNNDLSDMLKKSSGKAVHVNPDITGNDDTYIKSFYRKNVLMHYPDCDVNSYIPVLFFKNSATVVKRKYTISK